MALKYWYKAGGASDNWGTVGNWYLGSGGTGGLAGLPTSADDVIFDENSTSSASAIVTIVTTAAVCNSLDCRGFIGTLAGGTTLNITNTTGRGLSSATPLLAWGATMGLTHTGTITFGGTGTGGWIYSNGKTHPGAVTFNNTAATFTLKDDFTIAGLAVTLTITNGIVIAETNVSCNDFAYGTGIKSFVCSDLYLTGTGILAAGTGALNTTNIITNIIVNNSSASSKSVTFGTAFGSENVELGGSGTGNLTLVPGTTYKPNVSVTNTGGAIVSFNTGIITNLIFQVGTTAVWQNILSQTLTMAGNLTFTPFQPDLVRTPSLLFNQSTTSNITMEGKVLVTGNITVSDPGTFVNFLDDFNCPLIDLTVTDSYIVTLNANFTCASITNGLTSILFVRKDLTCGALALSGVSSMYIGYVGPLTRYNSQVTVTTVTFTASGASLIIYAGTFNCGTINISTGGAFQTLSDTVGYPITVNCTGNVTCAGLGTLTLLSSSTDISNIFNCTGTFSTGNGYLNITRSSAYFTTFTMSGTNSELNLYSLGMLYLSGTGTAFSMAATVNTVYAGLNSKIEFTNTSPSLITFAGGTWGYHEVVFNRGAGGGPNTINGSNVFMNFRDLGTLAHTLTFQATTTNIFYGTFDVKGSPGNIITIQRSTSGATYLQKGITIGTSGLVLCDYVNVVSVDALNYLANSVGGIWYLGPNGSQTGSTGWNPGGKVRAQSALGAG